MYAETVGCIYADFGCIYVETVGCISADVGCERAEMTSTGVFSPKMKGEG